MWEEIKAEIFENDQMDIYEKMCLIVLIGLGDDVHLSSEELARYMGCGLVTAKKAFETLRIKGYITGEQQNVTRRSRGNIITQSETEVAENISQTFREEFEGFREGFFKVDEQVDYEIHGEANTHSGAIQQEKINAQQDFQSEEEERRALLKEYLLGNSGDFFVSQKEKKRNLVDEVTDLIDEKISFKQANIILGFAENDLDLIKRKYQQAKKSQVSDKISVLINLLQTKESAVIKKSKLVNEKEIPEDTQINRSRIMKMQAYQKNKKW